MNLDALHADAQRRVLSSSSPTLVTPIRTSLRRICSGSTRPSITSIAETNDPCCAARSTREPLHLLPCVRKRAHLDAFDRGAGYAKSQGWITERDADHLDRQCRRERPADARNERNAANDCPSGTTEMRPGWPPPDRSRRCWSAHQRTARFAAPRASVRMLLPRNRGCRRRCAEQHPAGSAVPVMARTVGAADRERASVVSLTAAPRVGGPAPDRACRHGQALVPPNAHPVPASRCRCRWPPAAGD